MSTPVHSEVVWEGEQACYCINNVLSPLLCHVKQNTEGRDWNDRGITQEFKLRCCFWRFISIWSKKINYRNIITSFPLSKFMGGSGFESQVGVQVLSGAIQGIRYTRFYGTDKDETKGPGTLATCSVPGQDSCSGVKRRHLGPGDEGDITWFFHESFRNTFGFPNVSIFLLSYFFSLTSNCVVITFLKNMLRASLVAQGLRICLPMQVTRVRALAREDPTCRGATKPVCHNYWACALDPASHNYWAREPQLLKPVGLEPMLCNKRSHPMRSPCTATNSSPRLPQLEKSLCAATKTQHSQKEKKKMLKHMT